MQQITAAIGREKADLILFTGDFIRDAASLSKKLNTPIHCVAGNCDPAGAGEGEKVIDLQGQRLLLVHGHQYGVKKGLQSLFYRAEEKGATAVVFGHTHVPVLKQESGLWLINPGSPTRPRSLSPRGTFVMMTLEDDKIYPALLVL